MQRNYDLDPHPVASFFSKTPQSEASSVSLPPFPRLPELDQVPASTAPYPLLHLNPPDTSTTLSVISRLHDPATASSSSSSNFNLIFDHLPPPHLEPRDDPPHLQLTQVDHPPLDRGDELSTLVMVSSTSFNNDSSIHSFEEEHISDASFLVSPSCLLAASDVSQSTRRKKRKSPDLLHDSVNPDEQEKPTPVPSKRIRVTNSPAMPPRSSKE
jgi:hypothetical protein